MKFYTNIQQYNNVILERYIEDGEHKQREVPYMPTLYINSVKQTPFKTIKGEQVEPKMFNSIKEARNYIQEHRASNNPIYGMQQFAYAYIQELFQGDFNHNTPASSMILRSLLNSQPATAKKILENLGLQHFNSLHKLQGKIKTYRNFLKKQKARFWSKAPL